MVNLSVLKQLHNGVWLMEPEAAMMYSPLVHKIINGEHFNFTHLHQASEKKEAQALNHRPMAVHLAADVVDPRFTEMNRAVPNSIAVIPLQGVVMQEDFCGSPGINTLQKWMAEADGNANIIGHILYTNTPGGSAAGVEKFAEFITGLSKPVVAFVDGMACSAGYWLASAAQKIICAEKLCTVGSIGAFSTFYDTTKRDELAGVRKIEVYAPQSGDKNKIHRDIVDGNTENYSTRFLKPLVEDFHTAVQTNRPQIDTEAAGVFTGDVFSATEALDNGLCDAIASFSDAVEAVLELSKQQTTTI